MNVVGDNSPHIDDSMWFNGRLNPAKSNFVKVSCCFEIIVKIVGGYSIVITSIVITYIMNNLLIGSLWPIRFEFGLS